MWCSVGLGFELQKRQHLLYYWAVTGIVYGDRIIPPVLVSKYGIDLRLESDFSNERTRFGSPREARSELWFVRKEIH